MGEGRGEGKRSEEARAFAAPEWICSSGLERLQPRRRGEFAVLNAALDQIYSKRSISLTASARCQPSGASLTQAERRNRIKDRPSGNHGKSAFQGLTQESYLLYSWGSSAKTRGSDDRFGPGFRDQFTAGDYS